MLETMSVTEALIYMAKRYKKMCEATTEKLKLQEALPYLDKIRDMTRRNEIVWKDISGNEGIEQYYITYDNFTAVLAYDVSGKSSDEFHMYIETEDEKWFIFGNDYESDLINIYNWMTVEVPNEASTIIDADYEVIENDNTPFEFIINSNYNFEQLG